MSGHLDTTKYTEMVGNAASQVKISSTKFKAFIGDVKDKNDSNYDLLDAVQNARNGLSSNALINGNFDVWQRGTSFTNPGGSQYLSDRWVTLISSSGLPSTLIHSRLTLTPGDIPNSYYGHRLNTNATGTIGANDYYIMQQKIEYGTRYLCGANKKVTISFYAKSDIPGKKLGIYANQVYGTGGSPAAAEVLVGTILSLSSTWQKYSFTFTTNTLVGKTFGTNNDDVISANFVYAWGNTFASTRLNSSTTEAFVGAGNIDIAQVQINAGDQALPFQPRSFADELSLCLRYYEKSYDYGTAPGTVGFSGASAYPSYQANGTNRLGILYKVVKRTAGTVTIHSPATGTGGQMTNSGSPIPAAATDTGNAGFATFPNGTYAANNDIRFHYVCDAEI